MELSSQLQNFSLRWRTSKFVSLSAVCTYIHVVSHLYGTDDHFVVPRVQKPSYSSSREDYVRVECERLSSAAVRKDVSVRLSD